MNFWISEVKQYEETMPNEQSQEYQIDKITYAKGWGNLNAYMCTQRGCWKDRKIGHKICAY